jgi:D-sedoheptulose 7-phosphate isomerase
MIMNFQEFFGDFKKDIVHSLDGIDVSSLSKITDIIINAYRSDQQIFLVGNGGSAATAAHFANDLSKTAAPASGKRIRAISLTDNISLITAIANDCGFENIFIDQLSPLMNPNDVLISISASGNSPNLIKAVNYARSKKAHTISLLGFDGGEMKKLSDVSVIVKSNKYGPVETVHIAIEHAISFYIKQALS